MLFKKLIFLITDFEGLGLSMDILSGRDIYNGVHMYKLKYDLSRCSGHPKVYRNHLNK